MENKKSQADRDERIESCHADDNGDIAAAGSGVIEKGAKYPGNAGEEGKKNSQGMGVGPEAHQKQGQHPDQHPAGYLIDKGALRADVGNGKFREKSPETIDDQGQ